MKRLALYTALAATVLMAAGAPLQAQAAAPWKVVKEINGKNFTFKVVTLPEYCPPGTGLPEGWNPDTKPEDKPETENPETNVPEDKPEIENPDTNIPEDKPETENPDTNIPENKPETEKPETNPEEKPEEDNSYRAQVVRLVNAERAKEGLAPLSVDAGLEAAGNVRAKEIVTSFSHTRPDGRGFVTAIKEQGVTYRLAGENIAWGQKTPEEVVRGWMNSPGHRANIMHPGFGRIGIGFHQSGGRNYWVQLFAN